MNVADSLFKLVSSSSFMFFCIMKAFEIYQKQYLVDKKKNEIEVLMLKGNLEA